MAERTYHWLFTSLPVSKIKSIKSNYNKWLDYSLFDNIKKDNFLIIFFVLGE